MGILSNFHIKLLRKYSTLLLIVLIIPNSILAGSNINDKEKEIIKKIVSDFFLYYRERNLDKLSKLIDKNSPAILYGANMTGKLPDDISTGSLSEAITSATQGNTYCFYWTFDFIRSRLENYSYGWIKFNVKEISLIDEISILGATMLVVTDFFDSGLNPYPPKSFYVTENDNFRIVLSKASGEWKIVAIAHVFDKLPDNPYFLTFDADTRLINKDFDGALQGFRKALVAKPDLSYAHFGLALIYLSDPSMAQKNPTIAQYAFNEIYQAIRNNPDVPFYHWFLGSLYELANNRVKAEEEYNLTLHLAPDFPVAPLRE